MKRLLALLVLLVSLAVSAHTQTRGGTAACDRECLRGFITQYLDALVAHDPKKLATAPTVRFTEDTKTMPLGEGLWKGTSKLRPYRQDFLDVRDGQAMSYVVVEENGMPAMLALRLKIAEKRSLKSKRWSHETGLKAPFSKSRTSRLPGPH